MIPLCSYGLFLAAVIHISASEPTLLPNDPLTLKKYWQSDLLEECSTVAFDENSFSDQCKDSPRIATCYIARQLSTLENCQDAGSFIPDTGGLCDLYPDAYRNYCCQSVQNIRSCPTATETDNGSAQLLSIDYLPTTPVTARKLQSSDPVRVSEKYLLIAFPDRTTPCSLMQTGWKLLRVLALFFDTNEMLNIMQEPSMASVAKQQRQNLIDPSTFYLEVNAALESPTATQHLLGELQASAVTNNTPVPGEALANGIPSSGLLKNDTDLRFTDQFGQSESLPAHLIPKRDKNESTVEEGEGRNLSRKSTAFSEGSSEECSKRAPRLDDAVMSLFADFFSGQKTATELADQVGAFIDKAVIFINGTEAQLDFKQLYNTNRFSGLVTPIFMMIPPCIPGPFNANMAAEDLARITMHIPALLQQSASMAKLLLAHLEKCGDCFERAWRYVVLKANERHSSDEAPTDEQTDQEGQRIKRSVIRYLEHFTQLHQVVNEEEAPKSLGQVISWLVQALADVQPETIGEAGTLLEAILLFIDAVQRDSADGNLDIQLEVRRFIRDNFDCSVGKPPAAGDSTLNQTADSKTNVSSLRKLTELDIGDLLWEEFEDAADYRRLASRIRRQQEVPGLNVVGSGAFKSPVLMEGEIPLDDDTAEKLSNEDFKVLLLDSNGSEEYASGNLPDSMNLIPENHPPLSGYQCRDDFPGLYSDYLSIWLKKARCSDLMQFFGCLSDRTAPTSNTLLPLQILLNACPEEWLARCQVNVPLPQLVNSMQKSDFSVRDNDPVQTIDASSDNSNEYAAFFAQTPNEGPLLPLKICTHKNFPHTEPEKNESISGHEWREEGSEESIQTFHEEQPEPVLRKTKSSKSHSQSFYRHSFIIMTVFMVIFTVDA